MSAREELRAAIEDAMFNIDDDEALRFEARRKSPEYEGIGWTLSTRALDCVLAKRELLEEVAS